jgi:GDPmannose 4,6-dehydratase
MSNVLILGSNGAVGGYLARLLQARGANVFGVTDNSANNALSALGIADAVVPVAPAEAAALAANLRDATIFAINDGSAEQAALVAEVLAAAAAAPTAPRLCHVADADTLRRNPALLQQTKRVAEYRRDNGRRAVNAILHAHDSRLGAADTLPARITAAALRAARSDATPILDLAETGPRDWGWTAEYVDAVARLAALDRPIDLAIGSGHSLNVAEFAKHAFEFFKRDADQHVRIEPALHGSPEPAVDTDRLKTTTGWSASTWGRDLVRALCEGAASRT